MRDRKIDRTGLLGLLPQIREQHDLREGATGFSYASQRDETFVMPELRPVVRFQARVAARALESADTAGAETQSTSERPSLVLVEARAAVGKSMLARYLAWATNSPLWDLAEIYVGSGTLWGSLAKAFGPEQLNEIIGRTIAGDFLLVIDALDEAEMHAGGRAFDAFLSELRDMYFIPRRFPGAVLLGRTETVDYVEMFLGEKFPLTRYRIQNFDRLQAYRFIDNRLDSGKVTEPTFKRGSHRKSVILYEEARERLFTFLTDRLAPDSARDSAGGEQGSAERFPERVSSFLGYAPVLEAMAEYLASYAANYPALVNELARMEIDPYHTGNAQWYMLRMIVSRLLDREQRKVVAQLRKVITDSEWTDWEGLYTPAEQCSRVLARIARGSDAICITPDLPAHLLQRYRDVVKNALPNHPFLGSVFGYANVVFRDYVHAWGLLSGDNNIKMAVRSELSSLEYLPSPLLGPFVLTGSSDDEVPVIDGHDLGFVYESLLTHGEDNSIYIFAETGEPASVFIGSDPSAEVAIFRIARPDDGIQFWRRLSRARVSGELVVEFGLPGRDFAIGPDVNIDAVIVEAPARSIRVNAAAGHVSISASAGYVERDVEPELYKFGAGEFSVYWSTVRYPWAPYARPSADRGPEASRHNDDELTVAFSDLCRIAQKFGMSKQPRRPLWGSVNPTDLYSRRAAAHGADYDSLVDWLIAESIILRDSRIYYLDTGPLTRHGVNLFDLFARTQKPEASHLLERFLDYRRS
jgi:hypothetical protein